MKFQLALGLHNHQPVGNFQAVFEEAHQKAYRPFLELVERYPLLHLSLHQSGILWRWQEERHADYFQLVGRLIDSGQIDLLTGGFFEPILTAVPERDVRGQIEMLTRYLEQHFDVSAEGLWLTERIWEPHLPKILAQTNIKFLPVDDTHFIYAGFEHEQLTGPFVTENEGYSVVLLPIQKRLRYLIPFGEIEDVIDELKHQAERRPQGLAVYADDGEKFGVWPGTHQHCFKEKWLERFCDALAANQDWLEVITLADAAKREPAGRAWLPSASYAEMLHWSLLPQAFVEYETFEQWLKEEQQWERYGRFVRGGHWRGFLAKYDESNLMHKKMLSVSHKLAACEMEQVKSTKLLATARDRLYAGQCNCPYWHGVFGGLYLPHIRQAIYSNLIEADATLRQLRGDTGLTIERTDFDADGHDEIVCSGDTIAAIFTPRRGGMLLDLALNKYRFDVTDTLTRRREGYHLKLDRAATSGGQSGTASIHDLVISKEPGLKDLLVEDWYLKRCFIDHFLGSDVDLDRFRAGEFAEEGDFILEPYSVEVESDLGRVSFTRDGHLWRADGVVPVRVVKQFTFQTDSDVVAVRYELSTRDGHRIWTSFGLENNFNFQAGHAEDRFILVDNHRHENSYLDSVGLHGGVESYVLADQYRGLAVALASDQPCELWHLPIYTVSLSEGGFEKVYQGTTLVNLFRVELSEQPLVISFTLHAGAYPTVSSRVSRSTATRSV